LFAPCFCDLPPGALPIGFTRKPRIAGSRRTIDYRGAYSCFLTLPCGVAISNQNHLSSSETRVNAGIRRWKLNLSEST
jgi:hypothetical protein